MSDGSLLVHRRSRTFLLLIRQRGKFGKLISLTDSWLVGWARRIRAEAPVLAKEKNLAINLEMNYCSFKSEATVKESSCSARQTYNILLP